MNERYNVTFKVHVDAKDYADAARNAVRLVANGGDIECSVDLNEGPSDRKRKDVLIIREAK